MDNYKIKESGLFFEDFIVGQKVVSCGRSIAESDIYTFAGLSGDYNQIHTDIEFSKKNSFGQRVAHGLLILSIACGLAMRTGVLEKSAIAFREIIDWKFIRPVFIGDTLHVVLTVIEKKHIPRIVGGMITIGVEVINQQNQVTMKGNWNVLVRSKG